MGQNSSTLVTSGTKQPPEPTKQPPEPKTPNYVVPENRVVPNGPGDMENARKLLRPVSQELAKNNPEFAEMFPSDPEMEFLAGDAEDSSSLERSLNSVTSNKENNNNNNNNNKRLNGLGSHGNVNYTPDPYSRSSSNRSSPIDGQQQKRNNNNGLTQSLDNGLDGRPRESSVKRTQSLEKDHSNKPRILGHRRQSSLTPATTPAIPEDPREHLYNVAREEPFSNLIPGAASLPVQNSFQADISMNLTYAQLAEHRRQQRLSEYESEKEKRLKMHGAEIGAANIVPKSPFDRANLGAKARTHSVSTGSSDNGLSTTKKKKRAPAPPPPGHQHASGSEPPVDYDMDDDKSFNDQLQRRNSSASRNLRHPAPSPYQNTGKRLSVPTLSIRNSIQTPPPPPPPPPPGPPPLFSTTQSFTQPTIMSVTPTKTTNTPSPPLDNLSAARAQLALLKQMGAGLKSQQSTPSVPNGDASNNNNPALNGTTNNHTGESFEIPVTASGERASSALQADDHGPKRMSSLLQHDIVLAAIAQGAKQKKPRTPAVLEKPKDAAQVFREELQKAAEARDQRRQEALDNKSETSTLSSLSNDSADAARSEGGRMNGGEDDVVGKTKNGLVGDDRISLTDKNKEENSSVQAAVDHKRYSSAWTPEDDLGPDDDFMEGGRAEFRQRADTEGFKQSIVPMKIKDWKDADVKKRKKKSNNNKRSESKEKRVSTSSNDKNKFGSIRRFRNSLVSAFESIGKPSSSGKPTNSHKQYKSQDFLSHSQPQAVLQHHPDLDASDNWQLAAEGEEVLMRRSRSDNNLPKAARVNGMTNGVSDDDDDDDDDEDEEEEGYSRDVDDIDFAGGMSNGVAAENGHGNGHGEEAVMSIDDQGEEEGEGDAPLRQMKRAGVAYISGKGQIIVLPEYNTVTVDKEGNEVVVGGQAGQGKKEREDKDNRAPKLFKKKDKKLKYESTVRVQERNRREDLMAQEIRDKETHIERERIRQQEIERDFRRLRDLDTQERLQRMQTNSILDQITLMQRQQVTDAHANLIGGGGGGGGSGNTAGGNIFNTQAPPPLQSNMSLLNGGGGSGVGGVGVHGGLPGVGGHNPFMPASNGLPLSQGFNQLPGQQTNFSNSPAFTNIFLNQSQRPTMSSYVNGSQYTTHSSPIIGTTHSGPLLGNAPLNTSALPNLSAQELTQLGDYMRLMGVAPPVNQQQWAFLLSSVSFNSSGIPSFNPGLHLGNAANTPMGPDLSNLIGMGKTLESTVGVDATKPSPFGLASTNNSSGGRLVELDTDSTDTVSSTSADNADNNNTSKNDIKANTPKLDENAKGNSKKKNKKSKNKDNNAKGDAASTIDSSSVVVNGNGNAIEKNVNGNHTNETKDVTTEQQQQSLPASSSAVSDAERRIDELTSSQSSGAQEDDDEKKHSDSGEQAVSSQKVTPDKSIPAAAAAPSAFPSAISPRGLPANVYGPIGFRPVSFLSGTS